MIRIKTFNLFLAASLLCANANAATLFNFDGDSLGTQTGFTDTVGGLSATFSSVGDPGGFGIYSSIFETLTGNVLGDPGASGLDNLALGIRFSRNLSAVTLNFATADFNGASPLTLSAYENASLVGSTFAKGQFLPGFTFPEGEITFSGGPFNQIVISSTAIDFAIDNINAAVTATPEPGTYLLLGTGLFGIGIARSRRPRISGK